MNRAPVLSLLTKTPVPGCVKTRLHERLSPAHAAAVAEGLVRATVDNACGAWPGPVELVVWPDAGHPLFRELAARYPVAVRLQAPGPLGRKMLGAIEPSIRAAGAGAVMGCDIPHCPPAVLGQAAAALRAGENVIGETRDGGFYLLGLTRVQASWLDGIGWGGAGVCRETVARLEAAGVSIERRLPALRDIDTWDDLQYALRHAAWLGAYISLEAMQSPKVS